MSIKETTALLMTILFSASLGVAMAEYRHRFSIYDMLPHLSEATREFIDFKATQKERNQILH